MCVCVCAGWDELLQPDFSQTCNHAIYQHNYIQQKIIYKRDAKKDKRK